jgi:hypothetical protein
VSRAPSDVLLGKLGTASVERGRLDEPHGELPHLEWKMIAAQGTGTQAKYPIPRKFRV